MTKKAWGLLPTRQVVWLLTLPAALSLLMLVAPVLGIWTLLLDVAIVLLLAIDAFRLRGPSPSLQRHFPHIWSAGRPERIQLSLHNPSTRRLYVEVHQSLFEGARSEALPLQLKIPKGGRTETQYRAVATRRGRYHLGEMHLRWASPWGFWQRQVDLPGGEELQVWPDIKALSEYDLLARTNRQGLLNRPTRRPGNASEFDRLRPYQRGDEYRLVDWKATARVGSLSQEPMVRQLRQETDQNLIFMLDCGRTMTAETAQRPALDYALDALMLLSHVAARQGDKSGLIAFDNTIRTFLPPTGGSSASRHLLQAVCDLHATLEEPNYVEAFALLRSRVRRRCLVILFSNLVDEATAEMLQKLFKSANRHLVLWICLRDPGIETMVDAPLGGEQTTWERGAAAEVLLWRRKVLDQAQSNGVMVIDATPHEFTPALLEKYLEIKEKRLL